MPYPLVEFRGAQEKLCNFGKSRSVRRSPRETPSVEAAGDVDSTSGASVSSDMANELLHTGRRIDPETGLQLNRYRFYHQQLGRFINHDLIEYRGGLNLYSYVGGMPAYYADPFDLLNLSIGFPEDPVTVVADWYNWWVTDERLQIDPKNPDFEQATDEICEIEDGSIDFLICSGHGSQSNFGPFTPENISNPASPECKFLDKLSEKISKDCLVDIRHCMVGGNGQFMTDLARKLGCRVRASVDGWVIKPYGREYVYHPDGSREQTADRPKYKQEKKDDKKAACKLPKQKKGDKKE